MCIAMEENPFTALLYVVPMLYTHDQSEDKIHLFVHYLGRLAIFELKPEEIC